MTQKHHTPILIDHPAFAQVDLGEPVVWDGHVVFYRDVHRVHRPKGVRMETSAYLSYYDPKGNLIKKEHQSYESTQEDKEAWYAENPNYQRPR